MRHSFLRRCGAILWALCSVSFFACGPSAKQMQEYADARQRAQEARTQQEATESAVLAARLAPVEQAGDRDARAGHYLEAEEHYAQALKGMDGGSEESLRLRKKIVKLAALAPSGIEVPGEAKRLLKRGMAMVEIAESQDALDKAAAEVEKALDIAPWWGDAYFNLGLIREKSGDFRSAIEALKLYLAAYPDAQDAAKVENKIIKLEVKAEQSPSAPKPRGRVSAGKAGIVWVTIPGGSFLMGADNVGSDARPRHQVKVKTFQMAKTLVTNNQYRVCVEAGACTAVEYSYSAIKSSGDDQPVVVVWDQAQAFARWAGGRLPTEAEWEYAARSGGKEQKYPWGNEAATCERAVMDGGCGMDSTWPVCSKPKGNTEQGLCDMAGNVWEWVQDWYHDSYNGAPADASAWESPAGSDRVYRGGSWPSGCNTFFAGFAPSALRRAPGHNFCHIISFRPVR